jgi:hypothetical protein
MKYTDILNMQHVDTMSKFAGLFGKAVKGGIKGARKGKVKPKAIGHITPGGLLLVGGGAASVPAAKWVADKMNEAGQVIGDAYYAEDRQKAEQSIAQADRRLQAHQRILEQQHKLRDMEASSDATAEQIAAQRAELQRMQDEAAKATETAKLMQEQAARDTQIANERAAGFDKALEAERNKAEMESAELLGRIADKDKTNRMLATGLGAGAGGLVGYGIGSALTNKLPYRLLAALAGGAAGGFGTNYLYKKWNNNKQASVAPAAAAVPAVPGKSAFGSAKNWLKNRRALKEPVAAPKIVPTQPDTNQVKSASAEMPLAHRILLGLAINGMPKPE